NPWFPSNGVSTTRPPLLTVGKSQTLIPPIPPDPLDPKFPPLVNSPPLTRRELQNTKLSKAVASTSSLSFSSSSPTAVSQPSPAAPLTAPLATLPLAVSFEKSGKSNLDNFKVIPLKLSSPIQNNRASFGCGHVPITLPPPSVDLNPILPTLVPAGPPKPSNPQPPANPPVIPTSNPPQPVNPPAPSLVEKIHRSEDKTLHRLAPLTIAESGRPRALIPD
ncbi:unnamed protein product, partial [Brassica rapa]